MNYTKIDIENWERRDLFRLYTTDLKLVMNATVDIDVTNLIRYKREHNLRFYPLMMWVVSKRINARDEFKYAFDENGDLIRWDFVSPSYTDFNEETETFVKFVTEYSPDLKTFHDRAVADMEAHKHERGFLPDQPKNFFDISCLPWIHFNTLDVRVYDQGLSLFPIVIWGKYREENGRYLLPVMFNLHHAVGDGFHFSRFFTDLQDEINAL
jgi:chloramphenicol O-acetyltransferase type A